MNLCFDPDFDAGEPDSIEDCPVSSQTTHMVRGTWLSKNHNIFHYGLPSPLLNFLRSAQGLTLHNMTIVIFFSNHFYIVPMQIFFSNWLKLGGLFVVIPVSFIIICFPACWIHQVYNSHLRFVAFSLIISRRDQTWKLKCKFWKTCSPLSIT